MHKSTEATPRALPRQEAAAAAFCVVGEAVVRAGQAQPISQATLANGLLFVSGQVPMHAGQAVGEDITTQTHAVIDMVQAILAQAGVGLAQVLKVNVWLTDKSDYPAFHAAYGERFAQAPHPARSTVISDLIAPVKIEMEVVAVVEPVA